MTRNCNMFWIQCSNYLAAFNMRTPVSGTARLTNLSIRPEHDFIFTRCRQAKSMRNV